MKLTKIERQMSWVRTVASNLTYSVEKLNAEVEELYQMLKKAKKAKRKLARKGSRS